MTKQNKLRTGIFAIAMVLMCNLSSWAQSGRESAPASAQSLKSVQKNPAANELKNFKADASNPELSKMQLSLLQMKAELEAGLSQNNLSQEQVAGLNRRINLLESQIAKSAPADQKSQAAAQRKQNMQDAAQRTSLNTILSAKQITRSEFVALSEAGQKQVMLNNITVTDLVNATPENTRMHQDYMFYIPAADFSGLDISKKIHILNNPSNYIVVENASDIPAANATVKEYPVVKTHKISRAELNTYSPEKKKAIENSKDFVITD
ncbi:MAG TPA: hypothetical protein VJY62_02820 [Bacteroidia bacterium]|nr:hypothetical protein [Bacteroidia bacterium]